MECQPDHSLRGMLFKIPPWLSGTRLHRKSERGKTPGSPLVGWKFVFHLTVSNATSRCVLFTCVFIVFLSCFHVSFFFSFIYNKLNQLMVVVVAPFLCWRLPLPDGIKGWCCLTPNHTTHTLWEEERAEQVERGGVTVLCAKRSPSCSCTTFECRHGREKVVSQDCHICCSATAYSTVRNNSWRHICGVHVQQP